LPATIFFEIDSARLAPKVVTLLMAALRAIHTILGATASGGEDRSIVAARLNLCDELHDADARICCESRAQLIRKIQG
jgi:hypothetical protein